MIYGPFPSPRPEYRRDGMLEHAVRGPVSFTVYTSLVWSDPRVQAAVTTYLGSQRGRPLPDPDARLLDAVERARSGRLDRKVGLRFPAA